MKKKPLIGIVISILARNHIRNIVRGALAQVNQAGCDCIVLAPLCHFTQCEHEHSEAERSIYQNFKSNCNIVLQFYDKCAIILPRNVS